jgi:hypothetical protein
MLNVLYVLFVGTLVNPLDGSSGGIDLVFATYWFYPAKTQAILPKDRECIQEKMSREKERFDERSKSSSECRLTQTFVLFSSLLACAILSSFYHLLSPRLNFIPALFVKLFYTS